MKHFEIVKKLAKVIAKLHNVEPAEVNINEVDVAAFKNTLIVDYSYPNPMMEYVDGTKLINLDILTPEVKFKA